MSKVKIDPNKVIKVEPKLVKTPSPYGSGLFHGFMMGWMTLYLFLKLCNVI